MACFGRLILQESTHPQIFLYRHAWEDGFVLQDVGDSGAPEFLIGTQSGDIFSIAIITDVNIAGEDIVEAKDRSKAGFSVPAEGLFLEYDK